MTEYVDALAKHFFFLWPEDGRMVNWIRADRTAHDGAYRAYLDGEYGDALYVREDSE